MTATTAADLLRRAHALTVELRNSHEPIDPQCWASFDATFRRALHEAVTTGVAGIPLANPTRLALEATVHDYPIPGSEPADLATERLYRVTHPDQALPARPLRIVRGDGARLAVSGADPDPAPPALASDPHPLARLAVTLGVLGDLLHDGDLGPQPTGSQVREASTLTRHLLAIGLVAAGETIRRGDYADATRPLVLAQYCEHTLDTLSDTTLTRTGLTRLRSVHPAPESPDRNDRLEAAVDAWQAAARGEAGRIVPSSEVLMTIALQGVHLYAVTQQALTAYGLDALDPDGKAVGALTAAAAAAQRAAAAWPNVLTLTRPTLAFAEASRQLYTVLEDVGHELDHAPAPVAARALTDLRAAARTVADVLAQTRNHPEWLLASGQLWTRNTGRTTLVELKRHRRRHYRGAGPADLGDLGPHWREAARATRSAANQLDLAIHRSPEHRQALPALIERTL